MSADVLRFIFSKARQAATLTDFTRGTGDKLGLQDLFNGTGFTTFTALQFMQLTQSANEAVLKSM